MPPSRPTGNVRDRSLFSLAWPVSLTFAVGIAQPALDTWFLSQDSDSAAAGVGAILPLFAAVMVLLNTFGQAGAAVAGQFLGARRQRLARATFATLQLILTVIGVVLGAGLWLGAWPLAEAMGLRGDLQVHAVRFLTVMGAGMGLRALWSSIIYQLAAQGLTLWNLWASAAALLVNAGLNALFMAGFAGPSLRGTLGVALATVISWGVVCTGLGVAIARRLGYWPRRIDLALGWRRSVRPLLHIGLPSLVEPISFQLFQIVLAAQVVQLGQLALASRIYASALANVAVIGSYGVGFAAQILTSQWVGAGDDEQADRCLRQAAVWGCTLAFGTAVLVAGTAHWTLQAFTRDPAILTLGVTLLWVDVVLQPGKAANIVVNFSLRSVGDSRFPALSGPALMWTAGLGSALFFCFGLGWGVTGLWAGMATDECLRAVAGLWRWSSGRWKGKGVARPSVRASAPSNPSGFDEEFLGARRAG